VTQDDISFSGPRHRVPHQCRKSADLRPSPGTITHYHPPGGLGVRVDSGVYQGYKIPPYYDSLIGKLIVHGRTRTECMMRLRRALDEFVVDGIKPPSRCSASCSPTRTSPMATTTFTGWKSS
jgi:acetyl-CoA carboxylase biotin carboxylase subunit